MSQLMYIFLKHTVSLVFISIFIFLPMANQPFAGEKFKIAINDLDAFGVPETLALSTSDLLRTELFKTGYFHVMERKQMDKILEEHAFQLSGATEQDIVEIGKFLGVQLMAMGSINRLGRELVISIRLVDIEEARVKAAESVRARGEERIPNAVEKLAKKIAGSVPLRGKVVGLRGNEVIVSLGSLDQMHKGMTLRVQRLGEEFRDPVTGKILGRSVMEVALLRVNNVMNESLSSTFVLKNYADIQIGDIVAMWTGSTEDISKEELDEDEEYIAPYEPPRSQPPISETPSQPSRKKKKRVSPAVSF